MKTKYLIAIIAAFTAFSIASIEVFYSNRLSELENERFDKIFRSNSILLEGQDRAFRTIGRQIDAIGYLFEKNKDKYNKLIDQAIELRGKFDELTHKKGNPNG